MLRLWAIALCKLLAKGEYSVPIAVGDPDAGPQYRGHLQRISREEGQPW
jgi:hypothetical protein